MITQERWCALQTQNDWNESDMCFLSRALSQDQLAYYLYCEKHSIPILDRDRDSPIIENRLSDKKKFLYSSDMFWTDPLFFEKNVPIDFSINYLKWQSFLEIISSQQKTISRPIALNEDECNCLFKEDHILAPDSFYAHFSDRFQHWPIEIWIQHGYHQTLEKMLADYSYKFRSEWLGEAMNQRSCSILLQLIGLAKKQNVMIDSSFFLKRAIAMHSLILTRFWIAQGASVTVPIARAAIYESDLQVLRELLSHITSSDLELVKDDLILSADPSVLKNMTFSLKNSRR